MAELAELPDVNAMSDKAELLAELRDVAVPSVSPWPAPGWWILGFVIVAVGMYVLWYKLRAARSKADAWRQEALTKLNQLQHDLQQASIAEQHRVVCESSVLLRKVMMYVDGRVDVASLTDQAWLDALQGHDNGEALEPTLQALLTEAPYQSEPSETVTEANVKALLQWLTRYVTGLPQVRAHDR